MTKSIISFIITASALLIAAGCRSGRDSAIMSVSRIPDGNIDIRQYADIGKRLSDFVSEKDARIGIAVITPEGDTIEVNGHRDFPMLSVYKFPQALAVADYCVKNGIVSDSVISIGKDEILPDTWSPLREKYGIRTISLPLTELLEYSLIQSDNNACDILFRLIGGPHVADSLMKTYGLNDIVIESTEKEMHENFYLCYLNRSTPIAMAKLFDRFFRGGQSHVSPLHEAIGKMLLTCSTGTNRLPAPLLSAGIPIAHKTGTGDRNPQGRIIAVNDAGHVFLPGGKGYSIAVFVADSAYSMEETEKIISDISAIVLDYISPQSNP